MSYLFHSDVFMPERYRAPIFQGTLKYGPHARKEALADRYGQIELPLSFTAAGAQLIESEYDEISDVVIKQVWRQPLDERRDIVLVISRDGFVKTVWVNLRTDAHRTLNAARYVRR